MFFFVRVMTKGKQTTERELRDIVISLGQTLVYRASQF